MPEKQEYTVGFAFSEDRSKLALILKDRPAWQAGHLNGIGGKIEAGENPLEAHIREFKEETGVTTKESDWEHFVTYTLDKAIIHFYKGFMNISGAKQQEGETEEIVHVEVSNLPSLKTIPNLQWLIPMALDIANPSAQATELLEHVRIGQ